MKKLICILLFCAGCNYHLYSDSQLEKVCQDKWPPVVTVDEAQARAALEREQARITQEMIEKQSVAKYKMYFLFATAGLTVAVVFVPAFKTVLAAGAMTSGVLFGWLHLNAVWPKTCNVIIFVCMASAICFLFKVIVENVKTVEIMKKTGVLAVTDPTTLSASTWPNIKSTIDKMQSWFTYIINWIIRKGWRK